MDVFEGMQAHMNALRWRFQRAREVRKFALRVRLGAYHGRLSRVFAVRPTDDVLDPAAQVRSDLATFHVDTAFADGALRRTGRGRIEAEPADCGRLYGLERGGRFVQPFVLAEGPLRPGERRRAVGQSGRPLFHAPRSFLP